MCTDFVRLSKKCVLAGPADPSTSGGGTDASDLRCGGRRCASLVAGCAQSGLVAVAKPCGGGMTPGGALTCPVVGAFTMLRTYVSIGPGAPCTSRCWRSIMVNNTTG